MIGTIVFGFERRWRERAPVLRKLWFRNQESYSTNSVKLACDLRCFNVFFSRFLGTPDQGKGTKYGVAAA